MRRSRERSRREAAVASKLGGFVREAREARGMSLEQLAAAAQIDKSYLSKVERGLAGTGASTYLDILRALGLTMKVGPVHGGRWLTLR